MNLQQMKDIMAARDVEKGSKQQVGAELRQMLCKIQEPLVAQIKQQLLEKITSDSTLSNEKEIISYIHNLLAKENNHGTV